MRKLRAAVCRFGFDQAGLVKGGRELTVLVGADEVAYGAAEAVSVGVASGATAGL